MLRWILLTYFFFPILLYAQEPLQLKIHFLDKDSSFLDIKKRNTFPDSASAVKELKSIVFSLRDKAYLEASVDSLKIEDKTIQAFLHVGNTYRWAYLKNGNIEEAYLSQAGFRERLYDNHGFNFQEIKMLKERVLEYAENNGYPFATVWLDSIKIHEGEVAARIFMKKGRFVTFGEPSISGDIKISKTYLENYLGINEGSPFSREKVLKIRNRLKELPFLKEKEDVRISFQGNKGVANLFLERKKASRFDFLIGVLPNSKESLSNNQEIKRFLITGTFNAEMHNQFGLGERIFTEFEQLRPGTQKLDIQFNYPYVLNLPFGIDTRFNLYKRDSSYLDVTYDLGIQYLMEGGNYLKAFWSNTSSTLLSIDEQRILDTRKLPSTPDVSNATFGLEYFTQRLDYRFNPRKGWSALFRAGAGIKRIKRNSQIVALDLGYLYDSLNLKTFQYKIDSELAYYHSLFKRSTLKSAVKGGYIISGEPIFLNEQYRIGGNRLLRGFDEESVFATLFTVFTLEYRLLLGQNSYLYAFGDYGIIQDKTTEQNISDQPYGFGAGLTFETSVGLFGISLAWGSRLDNPVDFAAPKIHFGYISLF